MSFSRVNPAGWAIGDPLTSAQQNALDIQHANALDKTVAGDTLGGVVTLTTFGQIVCPHSGSIVASSSAAIGATAAGAIGSSVAGGLVSGVDGGFALSGSGNDWITCTTPRSYVYCQALFGAHVGSGFTVGSGNDVGTLTGDGTTNSIATLPVVRAFHQATLVSCTLFLSVSNPHSTVPATFPRFGVFKTAIVSGVAFPVGVSLLSTGGGYASFTAGSGAAWTNSGNVQQLTLVTDQNNIVDVTGETYYLSIQDEHGSGALSGNIYLAAKFVFNNILSNQPG